MTLTVTDLFCGAGGSSSGMSTLPGVQVRIAANHWRLAIESHEENHPDTDHDCADLSQVDPRRYPTTDILWASPECTNHSVAKGIKRQRDVQAQIPGLQDALPDEAATRSRATMWDVPRFAEHHAYKAIVIENVVDAYRWVLFPAWLMAMEALGYEHDIVWLNSMHAQSMGLPAPQSRDRMYVVFWRKGNRKPDLGKWTRPYAWCPTHGDVQTVQSFKKAEKWGRYRAQYVYRCPHVECRGKALEPGWLPASFAIDWSLPGERIGDRAKPLAEKTRERIRRGIERYWKPLVVTAAGNTYDGVNTGSNYLRAYPTDTPLPIQQTSVQHGVAVHPLVVNNLSGSDSTRSAPITEALQTIVAGGNHASLLIPVEGREGKTAAPVDVPIRTQSTRNETGILIPMRNHGVAKPADEPIDTVSAGGNHHALLMTNNHSNRARPVEETLPTTTTATTHALLMRNNLGGAEMSTPVQETMRTLTTGGHQSLIDAETISLDVDDCMFRMLEPHEIKVGMAFDRDYIILGNKREQVKQAGNAVTPPAARDLIAAVAESLGIDVRSHALAA